MDIKAHYESLTRELEALRDRVRNFSVGTPNWQTDGEWKESVLRAVLKGYLPAHIEPLRGFVITPERSSSQIDVLLYDNRKPVLFRSGDLVFLTPDAVMGIIEVKSAIHDRHGLKTALSKLSDNAELIRNTVSDRKNLFIGLFSYKTEIGPSRHQEVREDLQQVAHGDRKRIISYVCLVCSHFVRFWEYPPVNSGSRVNDVWHSYRLPDLAAGYFISNLIADVSGDSVQLNEGSWFPSEGKEPMLLGNDEFRTNQES